MEISYNELKCKQVINVVDGKNLGRIQDIVLDVKTCKILGLVLPNPSCSCWSLFKRAKDIFLPFHCICKIGVDVILVELIIDDKDSPSPPPKPNCKPIKDGKCFTLNNNDYKIN